MRESTAPIARGVGLSLTMGALYRPSGLQRFLAYLGNGDLPPTLSRRRPPKGRPLPELPPLPWAGGACPGAPPLPGGFPKPDGAPFLAFVWPDPSRPWSPPPDQPADPRDQASLPTFAAGYVAAVALGGFGLGLVLVGGVL